MSGGPAPTSIRASLECGGHHEDGAGPETAREPAPQADSRTTSSVGRTVEDSTSSPPSSLSM